MTNATAPNASAITMLSFTSPVTDALKPGGMTLWDIAAPPEYSAATAVGRAAGEELVEFMRAHKNPALLGSVARAIAKGGRFGGVEIGFFQAIAEATI